MWCKDEVTLKTYKSRQPQTRFRQVASPKVFCSLLQMSRSRRFAVVLNRLSPSVCCPKFFDLYCGKYCMPCNHSLWFLIGDVGIALSCLSSNILMAAFLTIHLFLLRWTNLLILINNFLFRFCRILMRRNYQSILRFCICSLLETPTHFYPADLLWLFLPILI